MSPEDRDELYDQAFKLDLPIEEIALPLQCTTFPDFSDEILAAYLKYTTFVFKVWINYDAAARQFYTDGRAQSCGNAIITPKARTHLREIGAGKVHFANVRFDIGTPFRPIGNVTVEIRPTKLDVGPAIDTFLADTSGRQHCAVIDFLDELCEHIRESDPTDGKEGLALTDVAKLARLFRRAPDYNTGVLGSYGLSRRLWMGTWDNEGYVAGLY